ncbi:MAG: TSUP family transporter, partial [Gemmatimonadetes bacterium]|nr:TSUP family transporter [Gemmatimonadota bacterium]
MIALGYSLALLIGVTLGLLGGGGSILTVPVLVYALGFPVKQAVPMSLVVVGVTSLFG